LIAPVHVFTKFVHSACTGTHFTKFVHSACTGTHFTKFVHSAYTGTRFTSLTTANQKAPSKTAMHKIERFSAIILYIHRENPIICPV